jgi:hypothetical protein
MGADSKLDIATELMVKALQKELPTWKANNVELDVGIRKVEFTKKAVTVTIFLSVKEGEEGFEVHVDWPSGFCRDSFRGFTSIHAEQALKSAYARTAVLEELGYV